MDVREELHEALDVDDFPSGALLTQTMARLDSQPKHHFSAVPMTIAAGVIAAALVVTLVAINLQPQISAGPSLATASTIDNLVGYQFVSEQVGWVHVYEGGDVIAKTTDGGRSWHRQLTVTGLYSPATMQAIDTQHIVVIGLKRAGASVWTTSDGGSHWRSHAVPTSDPSLVSSVSGYFLDPGHSWLMFQRGSCQAPMLCPPQFVATRLVYQTVDGGDHWAPVGSLSGLPAGDVAFSFPTQNVGIAVWTFGGSIAATHDGGRTWKSTEFSLPAPACGAVVASCDFAFAQTATMFDDKYGVLVATRFDVSHGYAVSRTGYATYDGGLTWEEAPMLLHGLEGLIIFLSFNSFIQVAPNSIPLSPGWYLATAEFSDVNHGWVTVTNSPAQAALGIRHGDDLFQMLATSDGGVTWRQVALPRVTA